MLRDDYQSRWNQLLITVGHNQLDTSVTSFYLFDEPIWNGLNNNDLKLASQRIKIDFPNKPVAIVEAAPSLKSLIVPSSVDWVGFDKYGIADPNNDRLYLEDLALLESKLSSPEQKILLIMESSWRPEYGNTQNAAPQLIKTAESYFNLAKKKIKK